MKELSDVLKRGQGKLSRKQDLPVFFRQYSSGSRSSQTELTELLISAERSEGIAATVQFKILDQAGVSKQDPSLLFRLRLEDTVEVAKLKKLVERKLAVNGFHPAQFAIQGSNRPGHTQLALGKGQYRNFKSGTTITVAIDASELSESMFRNLFRSFDELAGSGLSDVLAHF